MVRGSVKIALLLFLQILRTTNGFPYPEIQAAQAVPALFNNQGKKIQIRHRGTLVDGNGRTGNNLKV